MSTQATATPAVSPATTATGIDVIYYRVADLHKAVGFYRETLGLEPADWWTPEGATAPQGAEYHLADGSAFGVGVLPEEMAFLSNTVFFAVPDVHAAAATLRERGAEVMGPVDDGPVCNMVFVKDGQGNTLCLHQRKVFND
jgi:predicted enzyme related to lactoylglutathione lyase